SRRLTDKEYGHVARECHKLKRAKDAAYHKEKMLLYDADNSGFVFDVEPLQMVQNDDGNYNVFDNDREHPEQPESVNEPYLDDTDDLVKERDLLASLIEKLKCEIDDSKNRNKFLESSNKALVDKLKGEIEDFKTKNKSLESSNNHFKEANNELSKTNQLMFKDLKKFQAELDRYHDVNYASKVAIDCAKAKGDLMSYKMESEKSFNEYTRKINDLNQSISEMKKEIFAHQETISIMSQEKEAQIKFYKTCKDKEIEKVIPLENKVKALDDIAYKIGQSVQTINMLNRCYNDNLALMLAPESDETIRLAQESRLKEMVADLRYFNSLEHEVDSLKSQLETQKTQFLNEIDRLPREYYYADHMNAILVVKCERLEKELSKSKTMSKSFEALQKHAINLELALQQYLKAQLQDKGIAISELKKLIENINGKSMESMVKFENDQIAPILGYGDLVQGKVTIKRVYYVKGLNHNLFSVGQLCDVDLEVAFPKSTCYICDLKGNDLLTGSRGTDLYSITLQETSTPNLICLMAKASSS
ncbi:hypothetical protein Tco_0449374, partial [Tanacetum coccineum]